jgi:hypothetical protein
MSGPSSSTSRAQSISSGSSIGPPEWTCVNCQEEDGAAVELVESDGNMVCPQCAMIDSMASSARGHVDVNEISGQIMDKTQSLQSLESAWNDRSNWHSRTFMVSPAVLNQQNSADSIDSCGCGACYTHIFGRLQLQLQPSEWRATLVQRWKHMSTHTKTPKLVLQLNMAVRLASQEMNLISMYNKLKGKRSESPTAIRNYTKGDDRVPVFGYHEYFVSHEFEFLHFVWLILDRI